MEIRNGQSQALSLEFWRLLGSPKTLVRAAVMTTAYVANREAVAAEQFDDEAVLINFQTGTYYSLRGTGPDVWQLIQEPNTIERIAERLGARDKQAYQSIEAMLAQLVADSCVLVCDIDEAHLNGKTDLAAAPAPFSVPIAQAFRDLQDLIVVDPVHEADPMDGWPSRPTPLGRGVDRS